MARKKAFVDKCPFIKEDSMVTESGHLVSSGDFIKVSGQHGMLFKFKSLTTNPDNGKVWVDCYEMHRGITGPSRSFYKEDVKPVVKRGKRVKRT